MLMNDDDAPDWPPASSARDAKEGERRKGSTGQLWQARNGQWVRIKKLAPVQIEQKAEEPSGGNWNTKR